MVAAKEWYRRVNAIWPAKVPPLTFEQGANAAQRLHRFVTGANYVGTFVETSGRRYSSYPRRGRYPINAQLGWKRLIHDISHYLYSYHLAPDDRPHAKGHARLEMKLAKEVIRRGWLKPAPEKPVETRAQRRTHRIAHVEAGIERWNRKQRRALNALKKLRRKLNYLRRVNDADRQGGMRDSFRRDDRRTGAQ